MEGRQELTVDEIANGIFDLQVKIKERLDEKGYHCWKSRHEILGIVAEEYHEVVDAVQTNRVDNTDSLEAQKINADRDKQYLEHELLDLAVAAILGYINVKNKKTDW